MSKDFELDEDLDMDFGLEQDNEISDMDFDLEQDNEISDMDFNLEQDNEISDMDFNLEQDNEISDMDFDLDDTWDGIPKPDLDINLEIADQPKTYKEKLEWLLSSIKEETGYTTVDDLTSMEAVDVDLENKNQYQEFITLFNNFKLFNQELNYTVRYYGDVGNREELPILNIDVSELFIDGENHLGDLLLRFRRKLKNSVDENSITVNSFLDGPLPEEILSKAPNIPYHCKTVIDILKDNISVKTIENTLQQLKESSLKEKRQLDKIKNSRRTSLNHMKETMFREYEDSLNLYTDLSSFLEYLSSNAEKIYLEENMDEIQIGIKPKSLYSDNSIYKIYLQKALEEESLSTSIREFKIQWGNQDYVFSIPLAINPLNQTYTCNCDAVNHIDVPFESVVYFKSGTIKLPGINRCTSCGAYNYMPDSIRNITGTVPKSIADTIKKNTLDSDFNALYYVPPYNSTSKYIPFDELEDNKTLDYSELKKAITRYLDKVSRCCTPDTTEDTSEHYLAKVFMGRYNLSYSAYSNAVQVIIHHLETSSFGYGGYLKYSSLAYYDSILASKGVLNQLQTLVNDKSKYSEFKTQIFNVKKLMGIDFTEQDVCTKEDITIIEKYFDKLEKERVDFINHRNKYISDIKRNIRNLANLPLNQIKITQEEYIDYMCTPEVRDLILLWADYLVIYNNAKSFINFNLAHKANFRSDNFQTKVFSYQDFYTTISSKFFKDFNLKSSDVVYSLYPTDFINNVMLLALKLKKAYDKDIYDYCKLLLDFLYEVNSVKYEYPKITCGFSTAEIDSVKSELISFFELYPKKPYFYLHSQFDREEIHEVENKRVTWNRILPRRRSGESITQYIGRLKTIDKEEDCITVDFNIINTANKMSVLVDAMYILAVWSFDAPTINSINTFFTGKSIIDSVLYTKTGYDITRSLQISDSDVNFILNKYGEINDTEDKEEYKYFKDVTDLSGFIYKSPTINCELVGKFDKRELALYRLPELVGVKAMPDEELDNMNILSIKNTNLTDEYYDVYQDELGNLTSEKRDYYMHILKGL